MKSTIADVTGWEALDSRGRPTVACRVTLDSGAVGRAIVPSGASTGSHEAVELRDGGDRYGGYGVSRAVDGLRSELRPAIQGMDADNYPAVDDRLTECDGTATLERLGGNAVLAVSLAVCLAAAHHAGAPLWRFVADRVDTAAPVELPMPMINIFSGGAHAGRTLDIQDVLAIPIGATTIGEAMELIARVRAAAATLVRAAGGHAGLVADEGGLTAALPDNGAALQLVTDSIAAAGLRPGIDIALAVDLAATQFAHDNVYELAIEQKTLTTDEWLDLVVDWCVRYPLLSVEDPLAEDDWSGWQRATRRVPADCQLLGDDLFVTDAERLGRGIQAGVGNAVLIKPNQAGTLTRAQRVLEAAHRAGYATVVSARSGDTENYWLADLAVGWRAGQIKVGSLTRAERTAKWNRLLEISHDNPDLPLAGRNRFGSRNPNRGRPSPGRTSESRAGSALDRAAHSLEDVPLHRDEEDDDRHQ